MLFRSRIQGEPIAKRHVTRSVYLPKTEKTSHEQSPQPTNEADPAAAVLEHAFKPENEAPEAATAAAAQDEEEEYRGD